MSRGITEYHLAVLGYLAENKYGKRRKDAIFNEFVSGPLHRENVKSIIRDLEQLGYVKPIDIDEQKVQFLEEMTGESVSNKGYKITQLGKSKIGGNSNVIPATVYANITNSNIAHHSPHATQSIKISEQPEDIQEKFAELQDAITKKDASAIKKALGYIADKSVDVVIAIITGRTIIQ